jgi:hypothetical protein
MDLLLLQVLRYEELIGREGLRWERREEREKRVRENGE